MKNVDVRSKVKRKYKVTSNTKHQYPVSENLLNRNFKLMGINKSWVSGIPYIQTKQGLLYLIIILDLFIAK